MENFLFFLFSVDIVLFISCLIVFILGLYFVHKDFKDLNRKE